MTPLTTCCELAIYHGSESARCYDSAAYVFYELAGSLEARARSRDIVARSRGLSVSITRADVCLINASRISVNKNLRIRRDFAARQRTARVPSNADIQEPGGYQGKRVPPCTPFVISEAEKGRKTVCFNFSASANFHFRAV